MSTCRGLDIYKLLVLTVILYTTSSCMASYSEYLLGYKNTHDIPHHSLIDNGVKPGDRAWKLAKTIQAISLVYNISNKSCIKNTKSKQFHVFKLKKKKVPKGLLIEYMFYRNNNKPNRNPDQLYRSKRHAQFSDRPKRNKRSPLFNALKSLPIVNASSKAISKNGVASANAVSKKGGHAISEAATYNGSGNAIARSFAKDNGSSQATANATNGGDANAVAKSNGIGDAKSDAMSLLGHAHAAAASVGGLANAASSAGSDGKASALALTHQNGSSQAIAEVVEGHAEATAIHVGDEHAQIIYDEVIFDGDDFFDDPFFRDFQPALPTLEDTTTEITTTTTKITTTTTKITTTTTEEPGQSEVSHQGRSFTQPTTTAKPGKSRTSDQARSFTEPTTTSTTTEKIDKWRDRSLLFVPKEPEVPITTSTEPTTTTPSTPRPTRKPKSRKPAKAKHYKESNLPNLKTRAGSTDTILSKVNATFQRHLSEYFKR